MYHITVTDKGKTIARGLREGLADAVEYGRGEGQEGNHITVRECLQDATGDLVHLGVVLSFVMPEDNLKLSLK